MWCQKDKKQLFHSSMGWALFHFSIQKLNVVLQRKRLVRKDLYKLQEQIFNDKEVDGWCFPPQNTITPILFHVVSFLHFHFTCRKQHPTNTN